MGRKQAVAYDRYGQDRQAAEYWQQAAMNEAARIVAVERQRLELELQARLDQAGAELEMMESIHRHRVSQLRRRIAMMFLLAVGVAVAAGWLFVKKVRPKVGSLQTALMQQQQETDKVTAQLREQTEKVRTAEDRLASLRTEMDRAKKPDAPRPAPAVASEPAKTPPAAPAARTPQPAAPRTPRAAAAPVPTPAPPSPPKKACKCAEGDPMCGCL